MERRPQPSTLAAGHGESLPAPPTVIVGRSRRGNSSRVGGADLPDMCCTHASRVWHGLRPCLAGGMDRGGPACAALRPHAAPHTRAGACDGGRRPRERLEPLPEVDEGLLELLLGEGRRTNVVVRGPSETLLHPDVRRPEGGEGEGSPRKGEQPNPKLGKAHYLARRNTSRSSEERQRLLGTSKQVLVPVPHETTSRDARGETRASAAPQIMSPPRVSKRLREVRI